MKYLHPSIKIIKDEIHAKGHTYGDVAAGCDLSLNTLNNIMSGRTDMGLRERDKVCRYLEMSPIDILMRREDLVERLEFLDLRDLPPEMQNALRILHAELTLLMRKIKKQVHDDET